MKRTSTTDISSGKPSKKSKTSGSYIDYAINSTSGLTKGYVIEYNWENHYFAYRGKPSNAKDLPTNSSLIASIPLLFHNVLSVLTKAEFESTKADICTNVSKKEIYNYWLEIKNEK